MIYLADKFNFGKYRGLSVREVIIRDPQYIHWCAGNTEYHFSEGVYNFLQRNMNANKSSEPTFKARGKFIRG